MSHRNTFTDKFFVKYFNEGFFTDDYLASIDIEVYNYTSNKLIEYQSMSNTIDYNKFCYFLSKQIKSKFKI